MPELWPKLKAEAEFYESVAGEFTKRAKTGESQITRGVVSGLGAGAGFGAGGFAGVPVTEIFGLTSAYALLSPTAKKIIAKAAPAARQLTRAPVKAGAQLGAEELLPQGIAIVE